MIRHALPLVLALAGCGGSPAQRGGGGPGLGPAPRPALSPSEACEGPAAGRGARYLRSKRDWARAGREPREADAYGAWLSHRAPVPDPSGSPDTSREGLIDYIRSCLADEVVRVTTDLVRFRTVTEDAPEAGDEGFRGMARYLERSASDVGGAFRIHGDRDAYEIAFGPDTPGEDLLLVFHGDVVPADATRWTGDPFEAEVRDGRLFGRGTIDDKGPIAQALVVLRALHDLGIAPRRQIRIAIGLGEESDWAPFARFAASLDPRPRWVISVDSEYPVVVAEAGFVVWTLGVTPPRSRRRAQGTGTAVVEEVDAGLFLTQVPGRAALVLRPRGTSADALVASVREAAEANLPFEARHPEVEQLPDGRVKLTVHGESVHSSKADEGKNALWALAVVAERLDLVPGQWTTLLGAVARGFVGDHHGERLGLAYSDDLMGPLLVAPTMLLSRDGEPILAVNMRRPAGRTREEFGAALDAALERLRAEVGAGLSERDRHIGEPHAVEADEFLVETLLDVFRAEMQSPDAAPVAIRGGTYARLFDGAVSFGPEMPGEPYRGHADDEYVEIETLRGGAVMLADAVHRLAVARHLDGGGAGD